MVSTYLNHAGLSFFLFFSSLTRINGWCVYFFFSFFASYRLLPRYQFVDQTSLHGTQELVAGQSSFEIYESSEQEWIDISSQVNSGFMTDWTVRRGGLYGFFFVVIVLCTVFGRLAWMGGWISWIRANDECERLVGSDISIIGFLVITYVRYAEVYYTRCCKQGV